VTTSRTPPTEERPGPGRGRASVDAPPRAFNGAAGALLLALVAALAPGCKEEPAPMTAADAAAPAGEPGAEDAAPQPDVPDVPISPLDLTTRLPDPPAPIGAKPGGTLAGLKAARPGLRPSTYTPNVLVERFAEGPFTSVLYQIGPDGKTVRGVVAPLAPGYKGHTREESLVEAMKVRLGEPEPLRAGNYGGLRWTTIGYRIDLRTDEATGDLELVFHARGGRPLLPSAP
jgi:hypothetical protein